MMDADRWGQIEVLLDEVLELPAGDRAGFLDSRCKDDPSLHVEVAALVDAYANAQTFLERPAEELVAPLVHSTDNLEGKRVGSYRLLKLIARGGMGVVYLAARDDEQYDKKVALKLVRGGMDSSEIQRRFLNERRILARLEHRHIARLYDGGLSDDGRPYFVMEFVEGRPIDVYCDEHRLPVDARIRLFLDVCEAVAFAHRNLIVHRDLKPSNILVTENGEVKLLDFGIAKLLEENDEEQTHAGTRVMTPWYASPEQMRGEPVTTATDVYALAIVLYKLLTGRLPYPVAGRSASEVERMICETEPARLASAVRNVRGDAAPAEAARSRSTGLSSLRRQLAGDLDAILLKGLRKEAGLRYASVETFAEDLRRYLSGEPVAARGGMIWYRSGKFVRRHRIAMSVSTAFVVMILGYAVSMQRQADRVALERDRAEEVASFLEVLLSTPDPYGSGGRDTLSVAEMLDRASESLRTELSDQPGVQAKMLDVIGRVYYRRGQYDLAEPLLRDGLALHTQLYGPEQPATALSARYMADLLIDMGRHTEAKRLLDSARRVQTAGDIQLTETLRALGKAHYVAGHVDSAEMVLTEALALLRKNHSGDYERLASGLHNLAVVLQVKGDLEESERLQRQALDLTRRYSGTSHPDVATRLNNLANTLKASGDFVEAEQLYQEALALRRERLGAGHPETLIVLNNLALLLGERGDYPAAESLHREVLSAQRRIYGEEHPHIAISMSNIGLAIRKGGAPERAEQWYRDAMAMQRRLFGERHLGVGISLTNLATVLSDQGRYLEAQVGFDEALSIFTDAVGAEHVRVAGVLYGMAELKRRQGDFPAAAELHRKALEMLQRLLGDDHPDVQRSRTALAALTE